MKMNSIDDFRSTSLCCCLWGVLLVLALAAMPVLADDTTSTDDLSAGSPPLMDVSLQLPWYHQFQFAGIYAAIAQGYYRDAGLNVTLREYHEGLAVTDEVATGTATFGLSHGDVITARLLGKPLILMANYFKRPPQIIVARKGLKSLEDLKGQRLRVSASDRVSPLFYWFMKDAGLKDGKNIEILPGSHSIEPFIRGEVDAMVAFVTNEPFQLRERGIPFEVIEITQHLPQLASDYLFTSEGFALAHPLAVEAMERATTQGWRYALEHTDEIIDLIHSQYPQYKNRRELELEAQAVRHYVLPVAFSVGHVYEDRLRGVAEAIAESREQPVSLARLDGFLFNPADYQRKVILSEEERAWLKAHPVIKVAIDPNWAPIEYFDDDGEPRGLSIQYLKQLEQRLGVTFQLEEEMPWVEAMQALKRGDVHLLPAVSITPQRREELGFTQSYHSFPVAIFSANNVAYVGGLNALRGKTVAVVNGYVTPKRLQRDYPDFVLAPVSNIQQALKQVASGRADAYVGNLAVTGYYIGQMGLTQIHVTGETPYRMDLAMATSRDQPVLAGILNKGLESISRTAREKIYNDSIPIRYLRQVDYSLLLLVVVGGGLVFLFVVFWNHRLRKEVVRREEVERQLEQANEAKGRFLANVSHEIRTPLNAVIGLSHLLQKTPLGQLQQDYLSKIRVSSGLLLERINNILDFSSLDRETTDLNIAPFCLDRVLERIEAVLRYAAIEKGLEWEITRDEAVPLCFQGDEERLSQIILNLASNAVKYTCTGKVTLVVSGEPRGEKYALAVAVRDTGSGIKDADQAHLFEAFFRGGDSEARQESGTGLGLAISQALADSMGGDILLKSTWRQGSEFTLRVILPVEKDCDCETPESMPSEAMPHEPVRLEGKERTSVASVLLVEDDPLNQEVFRRTLEAVGVMVSVAGNGREALAMLEGKRFDLVLMDLNMPVMGGYEAVEKIRAQARWQMLPILALTAEASSKARENCLKLGMNDCLIKPIEPSLLVERIQRWLIVPGMDETSVAGELDRSHDQNLELTRNFQKFENKLGVEATRDLLEKARAYLLEAEEPLVGSIRAGDWTHAQQQSHLLRGSSNLYADDKLIRLLHRIREQPKEEVARESLAQEVSCALKDIALVIEQWLEVRG